ncbi:hypothetical protein [Nocardia xishanensis]
MRVSGLHVLGFIFFWPFYVLVWWLRPDTRPDFVQQLIAFVREHPKPTAWAGVGFGGIGGVGNLIELELGPAALALGTACVCGWLLIKWRRQEQAAAIAEIAARADAQHQAVMQGDEWGIYGTH